MIVYDTKSKKYVIIPKANNTNYYQKAINAKYGMYVNKDPISLSKLIYDKIKIVY